MRSLREMHPTVLLFWFLFVLVISVFTIDPILQVLSVLGALSLSASLGTLKKSSIKLYCIMFLLTSLTNPFFTHEGATPILFINGTPITLEATVYGALLATMLVGVMAWCSAFGELLTSEKILYLFGRIMPKTALVMSAVIRFIPMLMRRYRLVSAVQAVSGGMHDQKYMSRVKTALASFNAVLMWSLEASVDTVNSMKARGYGVRERTSYHRFCLLKSDISALVLCLLLTAAVVTGIACGYIGFSCYPTFTEISITAGRALCYLAFAILTIAPTAIELKERIRWKYYRSKI